MKYRWQISSLDERLYRVNCILEDLCLCFIDGFCRDFRLATSWDLIKFSLTAKWKKINWSIFHSTSIIQHQSKPAALQGATEYIFILECILILGKRWQCIIITFRVKVGQKLLQWGNILKKELPALKYHMQVWYLSGKQLMNEWIILSVYQDYTHYICHSKNPNQTNH